MRMSPTFLIGMLLRSGGSQTTLTELRNLFDAANRAPVGAMHLRCALTFAEETVEFEAVDLFELTPDGQRFTRLTIIYDSLATRTAYGALRERQMAEAVSSAVLSAA